ncbi:hypothetical protein [Longitalea arenae]|uniref:hypothetical protein n=1 Tax=Longitalea arenae TaxID=2812558 RepID=UPI001967C9D3|nr:hypothetical protein [Longitalea arenae]
MNSDNFDLVKKLLALPWYNLILISLLILPLFIGAWVSLLSSLNIVLKDNQKKSIVLLFIGIYSIGLVVGKIGYNIEQSTSLGKVNEAVKLDLRANGGVMGFKRIRERHPSYTEELLYKVAENFPNDFEITPIADPNDPVKRDLTDPFGLKLRQLH